MFGKYASIFTKLNYLLERKRKIFLVILLFLSVLLSVIETAGVSIIMPFISMATNPAILDSGRYKYFYDLFSFESKNAFILTFGVLIVVFYFFRAAFNIVYNYLLNKFSLGTFRYFAVRLFKTYLALPYKTYVQKNPSVFATMINTDASNSSNLLLNLLHVLSESVTVLVLYFFMLLVNWQITLVFTASLAAIVVLVFFALIRTSKRLGKKRYAANVKINTSVWEALNNFKFIKLKGNEDELLKGFKDSASKVSRATILSTTLGKIPKNILENFGFSLLVGVVCYILWRYHSAEMVLPVISMYALALYKMLPAINRILENMNDLAFRHNSLQKVFDDINLKTDDEGSAPLEFTKSIKGENLWFRYENGGDVIKNVSFEVKIGEKVAFVGESGSGKTTLVDIIIGIYRPLQGKLYIDNTAIDNTNIRSWRKKIGYIPQDIYLFDGSVGENVSFGSTHDSKKIIQVLKQAKIWDFLETKDGIETRVGEGGIQLSGGQKQRIGVARALYNDPEVLILDEATSSLDEATEALIMDEIYDISGSKTLIVIAHRMSTVERCDRRIRIESGTII